MFRRDGAAWEYAKAGSGGERSDGYEADVGCTGCQLVGALGGEHPVQFVAVRELGGEGWIFEVPHEGCGIKKTDCGDAEPALRSGIHATT